MFTVRGRFPDAQIAELGGEVIDSDHVCLMTLARELQLDIDDLHAFHPENSEREKFTIDNKFLTEREIIREFRPLAMHMTNTVEKSTTDSAYFQSIDEMTQLLLP